MFKIVLDSNPSLRKKCEDFDKPYTEQDHKLLTDMVEYLKNSQNEEFCKLHKDVEPGVGLALPQIGINKRGFAIYLNDGKSLYQYGLLNPKILRTSVKQAYLDGGEACLSVPNKHPGVVLRYNKVVLQAYDVLTKKDVEITAYGYLAICLQHEYDHLDGILYYDRINKKNPLYVPEGAIAI